MKAFFLIWIALLYILVGCSGIRGSGGTVDEEPVTSKSNKIFRGKVSQINNDTQEITINGVRISSVDAQVYRNSIELSANEVRAGQIISVEASLVEKKNKYSAVKIEIEDQLEGPIEAIDLKINTVTILGQTVHISSATSFTQKSLKTLKINYYLAVFGFRNESGVLEASLIELLREDFQASKDTVKLAGEVISVDIEGGNIVIEGVKVQLDDARVNDIKVGDLLSLNGLELSAIEPNTLTANLSDASIQQEVKEYELNSEVVLEGLPQKITAKNLFSLNGYEVIVPIELLEANNIESFEGRKLIVSGVFIGAKEVLANNLRIEQVKDFEFRGQLKPTGEANKVTVFGKIIEINSYTFVDFDLSNFLTNIEAGVASKAVYVKGYVDNDGKRVATTLSLNEEDFEQYEFIKGKIESIDSTQLIISGVSFKLNSFVIYKDENKIINDIELLALLEIGERVEIFGGFDEDNIFLTYFLSKKPVVVSEGDKSDTELKSKKVR